MDKLTDSTTQIFFQFLNGDLAIKDFEQWIYKNSAPLEKELQADLHFDLISFNYNQKDSFSHPNGEINISVKFPDGTICWPGQRVLKRIQNGLEDGIYPYGHELTKQYLNDQFDSTYWDIEKTIEAVEPTKPWWKFW